MPGTAESCSICWDSLGTHGGGVLKTCCGEVPSCWQCLGGGSSYVAGRLRQGRHCLVAPFGCQLSYLPDLLEASTPYCLFRFIISAAHHEGCALSCFSRYIDIQLPSVHNRRPSCLAGHLFCTECIQQAQLADQRCPVCRGRAQPVRAYPAAATAASGVVAAQCSGECKPACLGRHMISATSFRVSEQSFT